ncbi:hypothetical protein ADUPG1_007967, partial [Aduncisulcus paluster]
MEPDKTSESLVEHDTSNQISETAEKDISSSKESTTKTKTRTTVKKRAIAGKGMSSGKRASRRAKNAEAGTVDSTPHSSLFLTPDDYDYPKASASRFMKASGAKLFARDATSAIHKSTSVFVAYLTHLAHQVRGDKHTTINASDIMKAARNTGMIGIMDEAVLLQQEWEKEKADKEEKKRQTKAMKELKKQDSLAENGETAIIPGESSGIAPQKDEEESYLSSAISPKSYTNIYTAIPYAKLLVCTDSPTEISHVFSDIPTNIESISSAYLSNSYYDIESAESVVLNIYFDYPSSHSSDITNYSTISTGDQVVAGETIALSTTPSDYNEITVTITCTNASSDTSAQILYMSLILEYTYLLCPSETISNGSDAYILSADGSSCEPQCTSCDSTRGSCIAPDECECDYSYGSSDCSTSLCSEDCSSITDSICTEMSDSSWACGCSQGSYMSSSSGCVVSSICSNCENGSCVEMADASGPECVCSSEYDWFGVACNKECPVSIDGSDDLCSISAGRGVSCDVNTHQCTCMADYEGISCDYVKINDDNLREALCDEIGDSSDCQLSESQMASISGSIDLSDRNISDLKGLAFLVNVTSLDLSDNSYISDVSELDSMISLTSLNLNSSSVSEIILPSLYTSLTSLLISGCRLNSSFLSTFLPLYTSLSTLDLSDTNFSNPSVSFDLNSTIVTNLQSLNINNCSISDFSGFSSFTFKIFSLSNTGLTDLSSLTPSASSMVKLNIDDNSISPSSINSILPTFSSLVSLSIKNCNLSSLPDLSNSKYSLLNLYINDNSQIYSHHLLSLDILDSLMLFDASGTSIVDPSPLYVLSDLVVLKLYNTLICGTDVASSISSEMGGIMVGFSFKADTECSCSSIASVSALSVNKICTETAPGSNRWSVECSSDSYYSYSSGSFSCETTVDSCYGGCEYGYECRLNASNSAQCVNVISNSDIRELIALQSIDERDMDSSVTPPLLSVATLHLSNITTLQYEDDASLANLSGVDHIQSLTTLSLQGSSSLLDITPISLLYYLEVLDLGNCGSLTNISTLSDLSSLSMLKINNSSIVDATSLSNLPLTYLDASDSQLSEASTLSFATITSLEYLNISSSAGNSSTVDLSGFSALTSLTSLDISGWSMITSLPLISNSPATLSTLNISDTGITTLVPISSQSSSLTTLLLDGCDLSTAASDILSSFTYLSSLSINGTNLPSPSFLSTNTALVELYADNNSWTSVYELRNHSALEILSLSNNAISDPSPLYILSGTLTSLDLTENLICGTNVGTSIDGKLGGTSGVVSYS